MKKNIYYICFSCFLIDLFTKTLIVKKIQELQTITIIPNFFKITYLKNTGGAFNILNNNTFILIIISALIFIIISKYINTLKDLTKLNVISYGFILGGILGNLIDRVAYNYVIDFLSFKIFNYNFPVFNMADTFIVIGTIMLIIDSIGSDIHGRNISKR